MLFSYNKSATNERQHSSAQSYVTCYRHANYSFGYDERLSYDVSLKLCDETDDDNAKELTIPRRFFLRRAKS